MPRWEGQRDDVGWGLGALAGPRDRATARFKTKMTRLIVTISGTAKKTLEYWQELFSALGSR